MHFQLELGNFRIGVFRSHVGGGSYALIRGVCALFPEQAVFLQTAKLCDGVAKPSGVLLQVHGVLLGVPAGGGKIPGLVFI